MKKVLLTLFVITLSIAASAQLYTREAGLRGGLMAGVLYRQYLHENLSYEGLLSFRRAGLQFTLLRQIHESALMGYADNFYFIHGFGGHAGYHYTDKFRSAFYSDIYYHTRRFSPLVGVDGYAALEYRLESFPLSISFDYKPFFEVSLYQFFRIQLFDFAFSVRYRF